MAKTSDVFQVKKPGTDTYLSVSEYLQSHKVSSADVTYNNFIDNTKQPAFNPISFNEWTGANDLVRQYNIRPDDPDVLVDLSKFYNENRKSNYILNPEHCGRMPKFTGYDPAFGLNLYSKAILKESARMAHGYVPETEIKKYVAPSNPLDSQISIEKFKSWDLASEVPTFCLFYVQTAGTEPDQIWIAQKIRTKNGHAYFDSKSVNKININTIGDYIILLVQADGGGGGRVFEYSTTGLPSWYGRQSFCRAASGGSGAHAYIKLNIKWLKDGRRLFHPSNMDSNLVGTDIFGIFKLGKKDNVNAINSPTERFYEFKVGTGGYGGVLREDISIDPADGSGVEILACTFDYDEWIDKNSNNIDSTRTTKSRAFYIEGGKGGRNAWHYDIDYSQPAGGNYYDYNQKYCSILNMKSSIAAKYESSEPAFIAGLPGNSYNASIRPYITPSKQHYFVHIYPTYTNWGTSLYYEINNKCWNCHDGSLQLSYDQIAINQAGAASYFGQGGCVLSSDPGYSARGGGGGLNDWPTSAAMSTTAGYYTSGAPGFVYFMFASIDFKSTNSLSPLLPLITDKTSSSLFNLVNILDFSSFNSDWVYSENVDPTKDRNKHWHG